MVTSQTIPTQILRHSSIRCSIVHPYVYSAHTHCHCSNVSMTALHVQSPFSLRVFDRFLTGRFLSPYLSTSSLFFCYANELSLHEEKEPRSSLPSSFLFSFFSALRSLCAAAAARSPLQQDWLISKPSLRGIIILPVRFPRKWAAGSTNTVVYLVSSAAYYLHTTILLKIFRLFRYTFTFFLQSARIARKEKGKTQRPKK